MVGPLDCIQCPYWAVFAGRLILVHPYVGVYWRTSLMSSSLLLQQFYLHGFCDGIYMIVQLLFCGVLLQGCYGLVLFKLFSIRFVKEYVMLPYSCIYMVSIWRIFFFNLSGWSDFHMIDNLLKAVHTFTWFTLVWFLLHINHRLFNAKSFLYLYIKYMISKHILLKTFLNKPDGLVCLVLWHINLCMLFNAKSILMWIICSI